MQKGLLCQAVGAHGAQRLPVTPHLQVRSVQEFSTPFALVLQSKIVSHFLGHPFASLKDSFPSVIRWKMSLALQGL